MTIQSLAPVITIDGPTASGKGTIAARVAQALGMHLLDSGALYRLTGLAATAAGVSADDGEGLGRLAAQLAVRFDENGQIWLAGQEVSAAIRAESAGNMASRVAVHPAVRRALVERQRRLCSCGGVLLGAFEDGRIAGIASVERELRGAARDRAKMDILYVSASFRGRGVARELVERSKVIALGMGAAFLYVSATPSRHTVDFYLCCGARLAAEPDPDSLAMEPEDIHLEIPLQEAVPPA